MISSSTRRGDVGEDELGAARSGALQQQPYRTPVEREGRLHQACAREVVVVPRRRVAGGVGHDDLILQRTVRELTVGKAHVQDARASADRQPTAGFGDYLVSRTGRAPAHPAGRQIRPAESISRSSAGCRWNHRPPRCHRTRPRWPGSLHLGAPDDVWASAGVFGVSGSRATSPVKGSMTAGRPPLRDSANRSVGPQRPPSVMPLTRRGGRSADSRSTNTQPNLSGDCARRASHPVDDTTRRR